MCSCFCFKKNSVVPVEEKNTVKFQNINESDSLRRKGFARQESSSLDFKLFQNKDSISNSNKRLVMKENGANESQLKKSIHEKIKNDSKQKPFYELKGKFTCLLCGGKSCKHEDWTLHISPAIRGLNSDQINSNIFASQRLSNRLIEEYNLINQFLRINIGLVINLQLQGEHPYCGDKLDPSTGFSYDPQYLIGENIRYKNYGWKDMSIPDSVNFMLNIVKDMGVTIKDEKKKVLVHCHAGYGRTGVVIACYLLFESNHSLDKVVEFIRSKRNQCIQKKKQLEFCKRFKEYIDKARMIYTPEKMNIDYFMKHQNDIIFGKEAKDYEFIPKLLDVIFKRIIEIKKNKGIHKINIYEYLYCLHDWCSETENNIVKYKLRLNLCEWEVLNEIEEIPSLVVLIYDWLEDCVNHLISPEKITSFFTKRVKEEDLRHAIDNFREIEYPTRKLYLSELKRHFRLVEYEVMICFGFFLLDIQADDENTSPCFLYERMLEIITLQFTGLNPELVKYKVNLDEKTFSNEYLPREIRILFNRFNLIIEFILNVIKYNQYDDIYSPLKGLDTIQSSKNQNEHLEISHYLKNKTLNSNMLNYSPSKRNFYSTNSIRSVNKINQDIIKTVEVSDEKEQCLVFAYNFLDQYFKEKYNFKGSKTLGNLYIDETTKNQKTSDRTNGLLNETLNSTPNLDLKKNTISNQKNYKNNEIIEVFEKFRTIVTRQPTAFYKNKDLDLQKTITSKNFDCQSKNNSEKEIYNELELSDERKCRKSKKTLATLGKLESIEEEDKKELYSEGGNMKSRKSVSVYNNGMELKSEKERDKNTKNQISFKEPKELLNTSIDITNNYNRKQYIMDASNIYSHELFRLNNKEFHRNYSKPIKNEENSFIESKSKLTSDYNKSLFIPKNSKTMVNGHDISNSSIKPKQRNIYSNSKEIVID